MQVRGYVCGVVGYRRTHDAAAHDDDVVLLRRSARAAETRAAQPGRTYGSSPHATLWQGVARFALGARHECLLARVAPSGRTSSGEMVCDEPSTTTRDEPSVVAGAACS